MPGLDVHRVGDGEQDDVAPRLRLALDGDCTCAKYAEDPEGRLPSFAPVDTGTSAWPHEAIAVTTTGAVGLFGEHHSLTISAGGPRTTGGDGLFEGQIIDARGTARDTFWIISRREGGETAVDVFDSALAPLARDVLPGARGRRTIALEDGRTIVLGEVARTPAAFICNGAPPASCARFTPPDLLCLGRNFEDAVFLSDGALVLTTGTGLLMIDHLPDLSGTIEIEVDPPARSAISAAASTALPGARSSWSGSMRRARSARCATGS